MRIEVSTDLYNERRYGKPWIANVTLSADGTGIDMQWGDWIGQPGCGGLLVCECPENGVYATGQKDFRSARKGYVEYIRVDTRARLSKAEAYKYLRDRAAVGARGPCEDMG